MSDDDDREGFLARWSQRKREAARQAPLPETEVSPPGEDAEPDLPDLEALPCLEDLTRESDLSAFMQKGIPDAIRNAALRRVWEIDPQVRDYVGDALDYAWDWNVPGGVPGNGDLSAREARDIVARMFPPEPEPSEPLRPGENEKVIEHVAVRNSPAKEEDSREADSPVQEFAEEKSQIGMHSQVEKAPRRVTDGTADVVAPQQKLRRHGGAVPQAPPKV